MENTLQTHLLAFPKGTTISRELLDDFLGHYNVEQDSTCVLEFESTSISVGGDVLESVSARPFLVKVFQQDSM